MPFLIAFVLGAVAGSFLNVCIFRLPQGESVVFPRSRCRDCGRPVAWFDNIPCVSYFLLRGRCRQCGARISPQYVWVEFLTGALFVLFLAAFGLTVQGVVYLALSLAFLTESLIDFRHQIIPDGITLPGIAIGLALSAVFPSLHGETVWWRGLMGSLVGLLAGGGILYLAGTIAEWILKKEAMGGGDVKLLAMTGAVLGVQAVLWTIFVSSFLGAVVGLYLRMRRGDERIPYGPFLAMGSFLYIFFGKQVIEWYWRFYA